MVSETTPPLYWITECDHPNNKPITRVCTHDHSEWDNVRSWTRAQVHDHIRRGAARFVTAVWETTEKKYVRGAEVILTKDGLWITTEPTETKGDNLGKLPPCTCTA